MRILSVQTGKPRKLEYDGRETLSAIGKSQILGRARTEGDRLEGDRQADLRHHGGPFQAIYAYPSEHYPFWEEKLGHTLAPGSFGENLTTEGLLEHGVCSGDTFRVGSVLLMATAPRIPCYKLGLRHQRPEMVAEFMDAEWPGIYFRILEQGELGADDEIEIVNQRRPGLNMVELMRLYVGRSKDPDMLAKASTLDSIKDTWKERFQTAGQLSG